MYHGCVFISCGLMSTSDIFTYDGKQSVPKSQSNKVILT